MKTLNLFLGMTGTGTCLALPRPRWCARFMVRDLGTTADDAPNNAELVFGGGRGPQEPILFCARRFAPERDFGRS
ncbi:hypothetical protein C8F04DRAFT_1086243 [Mycena alexandri]|uniref:Secreted protein n=1 Tax=Mycena alexandri TaxID=1745969 RepID=A0AAD6T6A0_9AGAR|nr:hypothetical protein C8F04DRAFT_1086243 [Mycena alexandri]